MKKLIASISFACYFILTCGVVFNAHFCMNKLSSVQLYDTTVGVCGKCGMDIHASNGCCRDEITIVKLEQDQNKTPLLSFEITALEILAVTPSEFIVAPFANFDEQRHFHNHSPPLLSAQDTYLQNNVFRI